MYLQRLLYISMAAMATLGTLLLGMGQHSRLLPVLAIIVAVSSVILTDIHRWLELNTTFANVAAVAALALALYNLDQGESEQQLVAMANLLIYLQFVLMYRRKTARSYWMLALLSLLQVAVAAALNLTMVFGALMLAYMLVSLVTLSLFFIHREVQVHEMAEGGTDPDAPPALPSGDGVGRRWPLAATRSSFTGRQAVSLDHAGLVPGLLRQSSVVALASLLIAIMLFVALPRVGSSRPWRGRGAAQRVVGFSESVTLGALGEAFQDPGEVMQVSLLDEAGERYALVDEPLFRGAVLQTYELGRWTREGMVDKSSSMEILEQLPPNEEFVRQVIRISPLEDDVLFAIAPSFKRVPNKQVLYSTQTEQILRAPATADDLFTYELVTTALRDHFTSGVSAAPRRPTEIEIERMLALPESENGDDPLAGLVALARARVAAIPADRRERQAQSLTALLRDSGQFQYSLRPAPLDTSLDPIEDFVTNNRAGHCEYFATALTLMLRAVGIPARMAIGFKSGDFNSIGGFYQVRQLHAHTWVEVWLEPQHIPVRLQQSQHALENGAWLTLDPTPSTGAEESGFGIYAFNQIADFAQYVWSNYVMGMDAQRQQENIYQPVVASVEASLKQLTDPEQRGELVKHFIARMDPRTWSMDRGWFHWPAMIVVVSSLLSLVGLYRLGRWALACAGRLAGRGRRRSFIGSGSSVEFYRDFEDLLARHKLLRPASQTQHEFAMAAGGQLAESAATQHVAMMPRRIVEAFYRVRFGRLRLDGAEVAAVEQALTDLAAALDQPPLANGQQPPAANGSGISQ